MAAASIILSAYILFLGGPAWPFRLAVFIYVIAAAEEIAITLVLSEPQSNVRSLWRVLHQRQKPEKKNQQKH